MKGFSGHGATGRRLQDIEGGSSISAGNGGAAEVPNAEAELAGQTTDECMAAQRSKVPIVDAIESAGGAGALPDAEEERDRKAAKQKK